MTSEDKRSGISRTIWIPLATAVLVLVGLAALASRRAALAAPEQPIAFTHQAHQQTGVQCVFCHSDALRADMAGIPSVQKCMGCHGVIASDRPAIMALAGYWERGEAIPWRRVSPAADFVYFSHQPHLSASLSCETCHGDVGSMTVAQSVEVMDMGWCLECHLRQPEEKVARLADCLTCHK